MFKQHLRYMLVYLLVNVTRYKFVQGLHGYLCYETERILIFYLLFIYRYTTAANTKYNFWFVYYILIIILKM